MLKETEMHVFGSSGAALGDCLSSLCRAAERSLPEAVLPVSWLLTGGPAECIRDVLWAPSCSIATRVPSRSLKGATILIGAPRVNDALGKKKVVSPMRVEDPDSI